MITCFSGKLIFTRGLFQQNQIFRKIFKLNFHITNNKKEVKMAKKRKTTKRKTSRKSSGKKKRR